MGFLLECPNCGKRDVYEFRSGGEWKARPRSPAPAEEWTRYVYMKKNEADAQKEWWYHSLGCKKWFLAIRDTRNNSVVRTFWAGDE